MEAPPARDRFARLVIATRELAAAQTPNEVVEVVLGPCLRAIGASGGVVMELDAAELELRMVRAQGYAEEEQAPFRRIPLTSSSAPLAEAARVGQSLFFDLDEGGRRDGGVAEAAARSGNASFAALPLFGLDRMIGVLGLSFADRGHFDDPDERAFAEALAQQCALALDRARAFAQEHALRQTAERDAQVAQRLIGVMGHDLRNPLQVISVAAELIGRKRQGAEQRQRAAERISSNVQRMGRIIEDVLDFTRVQTHGELPVSRRPVDLRELLRDLVRDLRATHAVKIDLTLSGDLCGEFDPVRLEQLFTNILVNAVRYGDRSKPIEVNAEGAQDDVAVTLRNDGPPIPPALIPDLFEPFRRGDHQEKERSQRGLGLGLFIVRQIAVSHGGAIDVESSAEEGTRFTVVLPRRGTPAA